MNLLTTTDPPCFGSHTKSDLDSVLSSHYGGGRLSGNVFSANRVWYQRDFMRSSSEATCPGELPLQSKITDSKNPKTKGAGP